MSIFGQIERFGEKHLFPARTVQTAQLLVEELLAILVARPGPIDTGLIMAYSEKRQTVELRLDSAGEPGNPQVADDLPDGLGLALIDNDARDLTYRGEPQPVDDATAVAIRGAGWRLHRNARLSVGRMPAGRSAFACGYRGGTAARSALRLFAREGGATG